MYIFIIKKEGNKKVIQIFSFPTRLKNMFMLKRIKWNFDYDNKILTKF